MKNSGTRVSSRLGRLLLQRGWVDMCDIQRALVHQCDNHCLLGESLLTLGIIDQKQLNKVLNKQRWLRSFVASMVIAATPISPVLANEKLNPIHFTAQTSLNATDLSLVNSDDDSNSLFGITMENDYQIGFQHQFSSSSGFEINLARDTALDSGFHSVSSYYPQLVIFKSSTSKQQSFGLNQAAQLKPRYDRYKNTEPMVYRLSLKGYSIFEKEDSESEARFWELDKTKDNPYKSYEVMFSVSKDF